MLQRQFDEEDRLLAAERAELAAAGQQRAFDCGVCMDTLPEDSIARIEPCGHPFCRECVREARRFPVLCPTCSAERSKNRPESIGKVTRNLMLDVGTTQEQYDTWIEMEMTEFLILLQCRGCNQSSYFDREEFNEARNLRCPLDGACQQEITPNGPEHSCDGSSELKHLVQEQGWKFCPTCNTPCEKISGCNFISCISPGCNSHFCYKCSELIVRSAVPTAIAGGKSEHYKRCTVT
ncbi:hypothetical protein BJV77DRAFT_1061466 [Russula vinacea]|nr:hypothetical protein BJV77DRAFT_1061466 [Russula vinacea]